MVVKVLDRDGVLRGYGQFHVAAFQAVFANFVQVDVEFPEPDLYRQLPECGGTDVNFCCVLDQLSGLRWQFWIIAQGPKQDVGIQQYSHGWFPSNASSMSSGNGASKSSGTTSLPFIAPIRRPVGFPTGTRRAIARPCLAMVMIWPAAASSTSFDKLFFASPNGTVIIWSSRGFGQI